MALSQVQCLDDNHVNPRTHESKPEFLYCEDQRLALETLLRDGREAFLKHLETSGLRGFLSDPEMETLAAAVEPYDPGSELFPEGADDDEPPLSLHYWPELSDMSIPGMDLGWPDSDSYRGVTRTTIYSQPPMEGQAHIKEVVRKMIAQAQKVIAVVMDVFTDVDIFRDLLDIGFKKKVSVYILLERAAIPHFLSMCQRANMHAGHLKNLRVRCTEGVEFHTRSSTKVRGRMGHKFMFIDGDKAVSGTYSFTWMSSRLEKNLITVVTGQAVDAFDRLFRTLYATSSSVDLRQVAKEPEPEPEPLPQPASVAPPSAAIARKLYNPKYALALGNPNPSPTPSAGHDSPKKTLSPENSGKQDAPETKRRRRKRPSKEAIQEAPPIHPGLVDLEKACLMSYLPTWPEPDPPSDVIGFINIRDTSKPNPVHLQRSEMFGTSQAIKFSSPINMPKETLPEVATPRQFTVKRAEVNKVQPAQDKSQAEKLLADRVQTTQLSAQPGDSSSRPEAPEQRSPADRDAAKALNTGVKLHPSTPTKLGAGHSTTPHLDTRAPPQASSKTSTPPPHAAQAITTNCPDLESNRKEEEMSLNTQRPVVYRTYTLESNNTQASHLHCPSYSDAGRHAQTKTDSRTQVAPGQQQNIQTPTINSLVSLTSTSVGCSTSISENNHNSITTSAATSPPLTSSSSALNPSLPSASASSSLSSTPPVPKPRTIQLVMRDGVKGDEPELPEFSAIRRHGEPTVASVAQTPPEKEPETVRGVQSRKAGGRKGAESARNIGEAPQKKQDGTSRETKNEEAVGLRDDRAGTQLDAGTNLEAQSDVLITDATQVESANSQEIIPKDVEPKTLTSKDCKLTPQIDCVATRAPESPLMGCESAEVPNEITKNRTQRKTYRVSAHELQRISYGELTPQDVGMLDAVAATHDPRIPKASAHTSAAATRGQQADPSLTPARSLPSSGKESTHGTFQELTPKARGSTSAPEKPLRLLLPDAHAPDPGSPTPDRDPWPLVALVRTPTPDGFLPCARTPTPDSRTHTPDPRSHTPDFRTPTSDVSDGYLSTRADSVLSTTSEEYYECSDSPLYEPVFDRAASRNHGAAEDRGSFTLVNTPNVTTVTATLAHIDYNASAPTLGTANSNTSSSETQTLSGPASVSSSSSLLDTKVKMGEEAAREESGREVRNLSVAERSTEGDSLGTHGRGTEGAKRTADLFRQGTDQTETGENNKEAQAHTPKRKRALNQSAAEVPFDRGATAGELTNEGAETKRLSTGDLKPKKVLSEAERLDKEKAVERAALGPSGVERRARPQSNRETEGQKPLHIPSRSPKGGSSPSRPSKPPRPHSANQLLGARPSGSRQLADSKAFHSSYQVLDTSTPRRQPSRPPPPAAVGGIGSAAGRKQAEVSHGQSFLSRQPLVAQGRASAGQSPNPHPHPKPQASFLRTHANTLPQLNPHSQIQTVSAQEGHSQEDGKAPFGFTFSRLYSLKGLKDKMSKLPAQTRRSGTGSPLQGHKSTS